MAARAESERRDEGALMAGVVAVVAGERLEEGRGSEGGQRVTALFFYI